MTTSGDGRAASTRDGVEGSGLWVSVLSSGGGLQGDGVAEDFELVDVAITLENGEPDRAPEYARRVDKAKIRGVDRWAHLHIDTGRGFYAARQTDAAVREFLRADDIAPQKVRTRAIQPGRWRRFGPGGGSTFRC